MKSNTNNYNKKKAKQQIVSMCQVILCNRFTSLQFGCFFLRLLKIYIKINVITQNKPHHIIINNH